MRQNAISWCTMKKNSGEEGAQSSHTIYDSDLRTRLSTRLGTVPSADRHCYYLHSAFRTLGIRPVGHSDRGCVRYSGNSIFRPRAYLTSAFYHSQLTTDLKKLSVDGMKFVLVETGFSFAKSIRLLLEV